MKSAGSDLPGYDGILADLFDTSAALYSHNFWPAKIGFRSAAGTASR